MRAPWAVACARRLLKLLPRQLTVPSPHHVAKRIGLVADAIRANRHYAEHPQAHTLPLPAQPPSAELASAAPETKRHLIDGPAARLRDLA